MAAYGTGPIERRDLDWAPPVCTCNDNNQTWSREDLPNQNEKFPKDHHFGWLGDIVLIKTWAPLQKLASRRSPSACRTSPAFHPDFEKRIFRWPVISNEKENGISINHKMGKPVELYLSPPIAPVPLYRSLSGGKEYSKIFSNQWNIVYLKSWARQDSMCNDALKYTNLKVWKIYQSDISVNLP